VIPDELTLKDEQTPWPPNIHDNHFTDMGNGQRFADEWRDALCYAFHLGKWLIWDEKHWAADETRQVEAKARQVICMMFTEGVENEDKKLIAWAVKSESRPRQLAMIDNARPRLAITPEHLDRDDYLLNVENGTIDLRTGQLKRHDSWDNITKMAPVEYNPDADSPRWEAFLREVFNGSSELIEYMQRLVGYCLTGDVSEQILPLLFGSGANGKSTFLRVWLEILGPYAKQADPGLLVSRSSDVHPTNRADLLGARMVVCAEFPEHRRLAEAAAKQLTGGDRIKARYMYGNFFEFDPTFKLLLVANHKPIVSGTDLGIWRRIKLIPFTVTIPDERQDKHLLDKLRVEYPGILKWAVQGCLKWQSDGLGSPEAVRVATSEYRTDMDVLVDFVAERCVEEPSAYVLCKDLYVAYRAWADENGDRRPMSKQAFGRRIIDRGHQKHRGAGNRVSYFGLRLVTDSYRSDPDSLNAPISTPLRDSFQRGISVTSVTNGASDSDYERCEREAIQLESGGEVLEVGGNP